MALNIYVFIQSVTNAQIVIDYSLRNVSLLECSYDAYHWEDIEIKYLWLKNKAHDVQYVGKIYHNRH